MDAGTLFNILDVTDDTLAQRQATAVSKANLCPQIRLFVAEGMQMGSTSAGPSSNAVEDDIYPAMGARKAPTADDGDKYFATAISPIELFQYCNADRVLDSPHLGTPLHRKKSLRKFTADETAVLESLLSHAEALFARQHRTHFFQLIISGRYARFLRWDHGCVVISKRFNYSSSPQTLADFFWRLGRLDDSSLGLDPTVSLATPLARTLFEAAIKQFLADTNPEGRPVDSPPMRRVPNASRSLDPTGTYPTWTIRVFNRFGAWSEFVVRRPIATDISLLRRATRGYLAYDMRDDRLVFLKDQWHLPGPSEYEVLESLRSHGVPHLPKTWYGGDVPDKDGTPQGTIVDGVFTGDRRKDAWFTGKTKPVIDDLIHGRLVQEVLFPLTCVQNADELLQAAVNVLRGKCRLTYLKFH